MNDTQHTAEIVPIAPFEIQENEGQTSTMAPCVIVSHPASEPTEEQYLRALEISGVLDFWSRDEEDIYSDNDGEPA